MDAWGASRLTLPLPPEEGWLLPEEGWLLPAEPETPGPCWLSSYVPALPGPLDEPPDEPEPLPGPPDEPGPPVLPGPPAPPGPPEKSLPPVPVELVLPERNVPATMLLRPSLVWVPWLYSCARNWNT